jgi:PEP-CTERM motif
VHLFDVLIEGIGFQAARGKNRMRRLINICFFIAILVLALAGQVKADGNDNFTYQFGGNTFTWQLPASPNVGSEYTIGQDFYIPDVPFSENGVAEGRGTFVFYSGQPGIGGGLELYNTNATLINAFGAQVYDGFESAPTFLPSTYELNNGSATGSVGTLVISAPEPGSLMLLSVGMLGLIVLACKKIIPEG